LVWDVTKRLKLSVSVDIAADELEKYFDLSKLEKSKYRMHSTHEIAVYLDTLLPRIIRLCESGTQNR
jgi:hypothetical protein